MRHDLVFHNIISLHALQISSSSSFIKLYTTFFCMRANAFKINFAYNIIMDTTKFEQDENGCDDDLSTPWYSENGSKIWYVNTVVLLRELNKICIFILEDKHA